jgi:hypothetical protein
MSTATLPGVRAVFFYLPDFMGFEPPKMYRKDDSDKDSPLVIEGMPVFRSGTFRDSWGEQHTWGERDIDDMVSNYARLRDDHLVPYVPVRDGHGGLFSGRGEVVGWHTDLSAEMRKAPHDKTEYNYLLANYEVTEPEAAGKVKRGTWRNRSAEIGRYTTNADQEIWPAYMGVAYVDLPAVEGLEGFSSSDPRVYVFMSERGIPVGSPTPPVTPPVPAPTPASLAPNPAPVQPAPPALPVPVAQPFAFNINGQVITDPAAVQARLSAYETAQREATEANRREFVASLASPGKNKITAPQIASIEAFALTLNETQYAAWVATWDVAPSSTLLQSHGNQPDTPTHGIPVDAATDALDVAKATVAMHRRASMPADKLKKTPSYAQLVKAGLEQA